jgi:hypothetical protein
MMQHYQRITLLAAVGFFAFAIHSMGQVSPARLEVWDFDSYRKGVITSEMISPEDASWESFSQVPPPSAADYADASQENGVTLSNLTALHRAQGCLRNSVVGLFLAE